MLGQLPLLRTVPQWARAQLALRCEFRAGSRYSSLYREDERCASWGAESGRGELLAAEAWAHSRARGLSLHPPHGKPHTVSPTLSGAPPASLRPAAARCDGTLFIILHGEVVLTTGRASHRERVCGVGAVVGSEALLEGGAHSSPSTAFPIKGASLHRGETKQRMAPLDGPRLHACKWLEAGTALCLPLEALWPLPLCTDSLHRLHDALYAELLGRHPLLAHLAEPSLRAASHLVELSTLQHGEALYEPGDGVDRLYLVVQGAVLCSSSTEAGGVAERSAVRRSSASPSARRASPSPPAHRASSPGSAAAADRLVTADTASSHALLGSQALRLGRRARAWPRKRLCVFRSERSTHGWMISLISPWYHGCSLCMLSCGIFVAAGASTKRGPRVRQNTRCFSPSRSTCSAASYAPRHTYGRT